MWIVPQPFGSPLYIVLGHIINLFDGNLPALMTIILSCIPSAITISLVYLITKHYTNEKYALISSLSLLGCSIFLTQSTILEEYALAVMFVVLGFYFYIKDRKKLTALALGLGSAVHIMVIPLAILWLFVEIKNWREWIKVIPLYIVVGILPYTLILWLLKYGEIPFLANGLTWQSLNNYTGSTSVVGSLSIYDFPKRALQFGALAIMSFGVALIPFFKGFSIKGNQFKIMAISILFSVWYYLTCFDPTTWTFMCYACPFVAIFIGIGLSKMDKNWITNVVSVGACILIVLNCIFLNADKLSKMDEYDGATEYYNELMSLPDGSVVINNRGGFEGMALFYVISEGKDLIPIYFTTYGYEDRVLYQNYLDWMNNKYGSNATNTQELAQYFMQQGRNVYILSHHQNKWDGAFTHEYIGLNHFELVTSVDINAIVHTEENRYSIE
jgi:hypothetical protein